MAYYFINPQAPKQKQISKPKHGNKGKTKTKGNGKMLRLSPRKNTQKKSEAEATETEQSTIHKVNHLIVESPEKSGTIRANQIFESSAQPDADQQMPPPNVPDDQREIKD